MTKNLTIIIFFTLLSLNSLLGQVSVTRYDLDYKPDFDNNRLSGIAILTIDGHGDTLNLLLYRLLKVTSVTDNVGNSINFSQNVVSFKDVEELQVNHITIPIINQTQTNSVLHLHFQGTILGYTETGMSYVKDHISPKFTLIRMDAFAYPVQGLPSLQELKSKGMQYFDYNISVTVPDSLKAVTLGKLNKIETEANYKKYYYQNIMPSWRIDIAIGKYRTLKKERFFIHYFQEDSIGAQRVLSTIELANELFNRWFGKKNLDDFSIIEIEDGYGSQTDKCGIIQTAVAFKKSEYLEEIYHEVSHLWNVPHTDKAPCRLESEGLAMFLQFLVKEKVENKDNYLEEKAQSTLNKVKKQISKSKKNSDIPIIEYGEKNMTDLSYTKGMLFFYVFYHSVGEKAFFEAIKGYYKTFENSGSTTTEFSEYIKSRFKSSKVDKLVKDWIFTNQSNAYIMNCENVKKLRN
ncbi:MAG: M1 family aminopeptidase [Bacteroidales bacterium]